jgi:glyoxylase-like metal-dependent hydrolase (beta-lactamase superfamily II)
MILETFPVGPLACNCILLGDEEAGEAIVIDPGDDAEIIDHRLTELGLKLKQILLTHGHIDHVGGALPLKQLTGAPILLNENDLSQLKMMKMQASWIGIPTPETAPPDALLTDGLRVGLEHYPALVLLTPGHTQGSVCLHFAAQKLLIAGDKHRPHRPARRRLRPDHRVHSKPPAHAARRDPRPSRPRSRNHHRR